MKVSVIIVNWNGVSHLQACLDCLKNQTIAPFEVIVVDNGSVDGSVALLESQNWQLLKKRFLDRNHGFAGGNNRGLALATGEVVALLNNDARPQAQWIERALPAFADPKVGMVASRVLRWEDPQTIDKAGHLIYPDGLNRGRGTGRPADEFAERGETLWPDGCAGFYRKRMLDEIGELDEDFFLYGEDADLGLRGRWAGYRCIYEPESVVLHYHSASLGKFSPQKIYYVERNRIWLMAKNFPWSWIVCSPYHTLARHTMNLWSLWSGRGSAAGFTRHQSPARLAWVLIKANWDGWLGVLKMLAKRRGLVRRLSSREISLDMKTHRISAKEIALQD